MSKFKRKPKRRIQMSAALASCLVLFLLAQHSLAQRSPRFYRTFYPTGPAHLTLTNVNGEVNVTAWDRPQIMVRADAGPAVQIEDLGTGNAFSVAVRQNPRMYRSDFDVFLPSGTSLVVKNTRGRINITGVTGHLTVDAVDGDVHMVEVRASSVDVRVVSGDIFFDGELGGTGPYTLQSGRGDIDVVLPGSGSFSLTARALTDSINLGDFLLSMPTRQPRFITGNHDRGGPRLNLTTFDGHIVMHKK